MTLLISCLLSLVVLVMYLGVVWICIEAMKDMGMTKTSNYAVAIFPPLVLMFMAYYHFKAIIEGLKE